MFRYFTQVKTMKQIRYKEFNFLVNKKLTELAYDKIELSSCQEILKNRKNEVVLNYLKEKGNLFSDELVNFIERTGIDINKEHEFCFYETEEIEVVEVWFDFIGKLLSDGLKSDFYEVAEYAINVFFKNDINHVQPAVFGENKTSRIELIIIKSKPNKHET